MHIVNENTGDATGIDILKTIPFFSGLSKDQLKILSGIAVRLTFKRGDMIFHDGDKGDGIYIVETGKIKVLNCLWMAKNRFSIYLRPRPYVRRSAGISGQELSRFIHDVGTSDIVFYL